MPRLVLDLLAVAVGGVLGTALRLGIDTLFPHSDSEFPMATLCINLSGALMLGVLAGSLWRMAWTPHWLRAGIGTGLLGSYTTLSAVAASVLTLSYSGSLGLAVSYVVISTIAGLAIAALGLWLGGHLLHVHILPRLRGGEDTL